MDPAMFNKMKNVMHTAYYIAKKQQPFTQFPELHGLINRTGGTLPDSYKSDKACARYVPHRPNPVAEQCFLVCITQSVNIIMLFFAASFVIYMMWRGKSSWRS